MNFLSVVSFYTGACAFSPLDLIFSHRDILTLRNSNSKTPLTFYFQPRTHNFIVSGSMFKSMVVISNTNFLAEIIACCWAQNTPYLWFSGQITYFHTRGGGFKSPWFERLNGGNLKNQYASWNQCAMSSPNHPLFLILGQKHKISCQGVKGSNSPWFKSRNGKNLKK